MEKELEFFALEQLQEFRGMHIALLGQKIVASGESAKEVLEKARQDGYVTTLLNRRRWVPELFSKSLAEREFGERVAINTPIQGTAADLIKVAMVLISRELELRHLRTRMIIQVHDELVFEVPDGEIAQASQLIKKRMESAISLSVPIVVNIGVGKNWFEAYRTANPPSPKILLDKSPALCYVLSIRSATAGETGGQTPQSSRI